MCCEAICLREGRIESLILVEARCTVSLATRHRWFLRDISVVAANCSELVCLVIAAKRESNLLPSINARVSYCYFFKLVKRLKVEEYLTYRQRNWNLRQAELENLLLRVEHHRTWCDYFGYFDRMILRYRRYYCTYIRWWFFLFSLQSSRLLKLIAAAFMLQVINSW